MLESNYRHLVKFKDEVETILRKKLPVVMDKTLANKNITLSRGLVLVNSKVQTSNIDYKGKDPVRILGNGFIVNNIFSDKSKK